MRSFCCECFFFLFYLHFPWSLDYFDLVLDKNIRTARACCNFSPASFPKKYNHFVCYRLRENKLLFHVEWKVSFTLYCYYLSYLPIFSSLFPKLDLKLTEFSKLVLFGLNASSLAHLITLWPTRLKFI